MKRKKSKLFIVIVFVLVLIEVSSVFLTYKSYMAKPTPNSDELYETVEENNMFAIMLGKDGIYEESKESIWPDISLYTFNEEKSICVNHKGEVLFNVLSFDYDNPKAIIKTTSATYCSLYFDYDNIGPQPFEFYIGESTVPKYATSTSTTASLAWKDTDIASYCLTEESTNTNCNWVNVSGYSISSSYFLSMGDGEKKVYAYLKDKAGNISERVDDDIILDTTPPVINSVTKTSDEPTRITVSVSASDTNGIARYYYQIGNNTVRNSTANTYTFTGLTEGTQYTVKIYVEDRAGNISLTNTSNFSTKKLTIEDCTGTIGACLLKYPTSGLNPEIEGGLYRYQGTNPNNYICFGTSDKTTCTGNHDRYMYRIIGMDLSKRLKLIKKEALNIAMQWYTDVYTDTEWNQTIIYSNINGDKFLNNTTYVSSWSDKIVTINWKYGDNTIGSTTAANLYSIENAWSTTVSAKIGLMYMHDYYYAYQKGGLNCFTNASTCKQSWMHLTNNDTDTRPPTYDEWTMSRYGLMNGYYRGWRVFSNGIINYYDVDKMYSIRPVFFLTNTVSYKSGSGTLDDPFIVN